jgi:CIC family chloride channel protein
VGRNGKQRPRASSHERRRDPRPVISRRLPSARGAIEQPNAGHDGDARLSLEFWVLVALTGVLTGLFGIVMMGILHGVAYLAFGGGPGNFESHVISASGARRVAALAIGGAVVGPAWFLLRRLTHGESADLDDSLWNGRGELSARRSLVSSILSEVAVGSGASIGREAAPKLMGAVSASVLAGWRRLSPAQQRLLVACGGGAGMAAVYNVPLGGALISAELLYGSVSLPVVLPAMACSFIATGVSWIALPRSATYTNVPPYHLHAALVVWAVLVGPVLGAVSVAYVRVIGWVSHHRLSGWPSVAAPLLAFSILGLAALRYPQLLGNGKDMALDAFLGRGNLTLFLALGLLKPLVTALCLESGATGGLFTPTMSTGAMLGGFLGLAWSTAWSGGALGAYALVGAAALTGAATQAPLSSLVLVLELTRTSDTLIVPILAATVIATATGRYLDGYSIYSARLPAAPSAPNDPAQ